MYTCILSAEDNIKVNRNFEKHAGWQRVLFDIFFQKDTNKYRVICISVCSTLFNANVSTKCTFVLYLDSVSNYSDFLAFPTPRSLALLTNRKRKKTKCKILWTPAANLDYAINYFYCSILTDMFLRFPNMDVASSVCLCVRHYVFLLFYYFVTLIDKVYKVKVNMSQPPNTFYKI